MRCPTSPASPTSGGSARTHAPTATASSTVTSGSPSSPPAPAASTSRFYCMHQWSDDVVLLSNGSHGLAADQRARVDALAIPIVETPVAALEGDDQGRLRRVRLDDGETL